MKPAALHDADDERSLTPHEALPLARSALRAILAIGEEIHKSAPGVLNRDEVLQRMLVACFELAGACDALLPHVRLAPPRPSLLRRTWASFVNAVRWLAS